MSESSITDGLTLRAAPAADAESKYVATAAQKPGDVNTSDPNRGKPSVVIGAGKPIAIGDEVTALTAGRFSGPAVSGDTFAAGDTLYWHPTNKNLTTTATGATQVGKSYGAKASGVAWGQVDLNAP